MKNFLHPGLAVVVKYSWKIETRLVGDKNMNLKTRDLGENKVVFHLFTIFLIYIR